MTISTGCALLRARTKDCPNDRLGSLSRSATNFLGFWALRCWPTLDSALTKSQRSASFSSSQSDQSLSWRLLDYQQAYTSSFQIFLHFFSQTPSQTAYSLRRPPSVSSAEVTESWLRRLLRRTPAAELVELVASGSAAFAAPNLRRLESTKRRREHWKIERFGVSLQFGFWFGRWRKEVKLKFSFGDPASTTCSFGPSFQKRQEALET